MLTRCFLTGVGVVFFAPFQAQAVGRHSLHGGGGSVGGAFGFSAGVLKMNKCDEPCGLGLPPVWAGQLLCVRLGASGPL